MDLKTFLERNYSIDSLNKVILGISTAAIKISNSIRNNNTYEGKNKIAHNADGDKQKPLDIFADECILKSINNSSVAAYCSEEQDGMTNLDKNGKYLIFCDPLDGSSNIDNNISIGTIFSILTFKNGSIDNSLKQNGKSQLCAGFFVYGPQTTLILSLGNGVHSFYYDHTNNQFNILNPNILIPKSSNTFSSILEFELRTSSEGPASPSTGGYNKSTEGKLYPFEVSKFREVCLGFFLSVDLMLFIIFLLFPNTLSFFS